MVLSLGWTTTEISAYTDKEVNEMLELCKRHKLVHVTFPVRASLIKMAWSQLRQLLVLDTYTFTVWKGPEDITDDDRQWLYKNLPETRTFFDI